jgi:hypothetical protein
MAAKLLPNTSYDEDSLPCINHLGNESTSDDCFDDAFNIIRDSMYKPFVVISAVPRRRR